MSEKLGNEKELIELIEKVALTGRGRLEEVKRLAAMKKSNAPEFERMEEAMEGVSRLGGEDTPEKIMTCLEELEQATLAYQKHVDDDFVKRVSPIGKERKRFAMDSASFAARAKEKIQVAAKGLKPNKGIFAQIAAAAREKRGANPMVEVVGLEELQGRIAGKEAKAEKGGKATEKKAKAEKEGKATEKDGRTAEIGGKAVGKGSRATGKRRVRRAEKTPGKKQEKGKKTSVAPEMLRKVFGNERFNQEFRAAIKQDTTPEDLTDEELMEFLCDAMEQCFDHCREEEVEELEELADILGLEVTHEDPDVDLQKEKEKVLRREMTREPSFK